MGEAMTAAARDVLAERVAFQRRWRAALHGVYAQTQRRQVTMSVKDEDEHRAVKAESLSAWPVAGYYGGKMTRVLIDYDDHSSMSIGDPESLAALTALNLPELQEENKRMREALEKIERHSADKYSRGTARAALPKQDENK